jgi:membrane protein YqaA with SNARE-associated domain
MDAALALPSLFAAAFLAATPVPMNSEIPFVAALLAALADPWVLLAVVSVGNTLGSVLTWGVGRGAVGGRLARWMKIAPDRMARAESWFERRGRWALLLSWAPGGDFLCFAAGALRLPLRVFLPIVALAKTARYAVVAALALGVAG